MTYKNNDNVIKQLLVHASAVRMSRYWLLGKSCASSNSSLFRALQTSHWSAQYLDIRAAEAWTNRFITLSEAINAEVNLNFCYCTSTRLCLPHSYVFVLKLRDSLLKSLKIILKKMAKSKIEVPENCSVIHRKNSIWKKKLCKHAVARTARADDNNNTHLFSLL